MNAPCKPEFEGQLIKFYSPSGVILLDIAKRNEKYGWLEWWAVPHDHPNFKSMLKEALFP